VVAYLFPLYATEETVSLNQPTPLTTLLFYLRTFYGALAVLIPALIALTTGLILWALTRNKRKALNCMTLLLGWIGSAASGLRLTIENASILQQHRPAVFVFNHQSGIDPIILCRLLRRDVIGIAKIELKSHPVIGPLLAFGDTIFIDRQDKSSKRKLMDSASNTLSGTLSIAIAPEGTRTKNTHSDSCMSVGSFKSGAFRLARESSRPIVPIIIFNSGRILRPNRLDIKPGHVQIKILPAIYPDDWQKESPEEMALKLQTTYDSQLKEYASR